jgi:hypothetical protein
MLFFFKEKPITITSYIPVNYSLVERFTPIANARDFFPNWWKNTPSSRFNWDIMKRENTAKSCPGINGMLQKGAILPMWCDFALKTQGVDYSWQYSDHMSTFNHHSNDQVPNFYSNYFIFKFESPWLIETPVPLFYTFPHYLFTEPPDYIIPSGIVSPIQKSASTNIFMYTKREEEEKKYFIKAGTPMLQIIPLTEKKVIFKTEIVSRDDYEKLDKKVSYLNHFVGRGLKNIFQEKNNK